MSGLATAGFDLVIGFPEGPLAEILIRSPDVRLPFSDGPFDFVLDSGERIRFRMRVGRPIHIGFNRGSPPRTLVLTCPLELLRLRSEDDVVVEIGDISLRVIMAPALNAEGTQALLRSDEEASGVGARPLQPELLPGMTSADLTRLLDTEVVRRTLERIGDIPLHLPVALSDPADGTQIERLGAGFTSEGVAAVLVGVRTGATHTEPAGELAVPSFIDDPTQAGWIVRSGYLLEQMIGPGLEESFPTADINYSASEEKLEAETPPPIFEDGNLRITSIRTWVDRENGVIELSGHFEDSGFGWDASGSFSTSIRIECEGNELRITVDPIESDARIELEWWAILGLLVIIAVIVAAIAIGVGALIFAIFGSVIATIIGGIATGAALALGGGIGLSIIVDDTGLGLSQATLDTTIRPLRGFGPLEVPLPTVVEGLVLENCELDDAVFRGRFRYRDAAPVRAEGSTLLEPGSLLDLDTGAVFRAGEAHSAAVVPRYDLTIPGGGLFRGQSGDSVSVGDLRSFDPARLAITGVAFDDLTLVDLLDLSYHWKHLPSLVGPVGDLVVAPGSAGGTPAEPGTGPEVLDVGPAGGPLVSVVVGEVADRPLVTVGPGPWQTFAVRTSDGLYAKCRARVENRAIRLEYLTYEDVTAPAVEIGGRAAVAESQRRDVATVELAHTISHWVEPVNLTWPLTMNWTFAGEALRPGTTAVDIGGTSVDVDVSEERLAFRTPLGTNVDAELGVSVTDASGRTVSTTRRVQLPGRRLEVPAATDAFRTAGSVGTGDVVMTLAGAGRDAVRLRLPAGMVSAVRQPSRVGLRPAVEVLREALEASGYNLSGEAQDNSETAYDT